MLNTLLRRYGNLPELCRRWLTSRRELLRRIDSLEAERVALREKLQATQHAKEQAVRQAEERLREKEALRTKLTNQKKLVEGEQRTSEQLKDKIFELREEVERLDRIVKRR